LFDAEEGKPSSYSLPLFSSTHLESHVLDPDKAKPLFDVDTAGMIKLLDKGMSCNHDSKLTFPIYCGAGLLSVYKGRLVAVASDGINLTYAELAAGESFASKGEEIKHYLPSSGIKDILSAFEGSESEKVKILTDGRQVFFKTSGGGEPSLSIMVSTRLVECSQSIPFANILEQVVEREAVAFDVKKIRSALDRIGIISKQGNSIVSISIEGSYMTIQANEGGVGVGDEILECDGAPMKEKVRVSVAYKRLQKALRIFSGDVNIRVLNGGSKGFLSCESDLGDIVSIVATIKS
ncbi:MAG: hypothetical protein ACQ5SW_08095, partial [Sphaerochaetaceae bacterium]